MWNFIQQQVFPGIYATYINSKISKLYEIQLKYEVDVSDIAGSEKEYMAKFELELKNQLDRKVKTEDKAKSLLFIISLTITAITFSLSYLKENSNQIIPIIFIFLSILYFVFAGIRSLQTLNIKRFHLIQPKIEIRDDLFVLTKDPETSLILKDMISSKSLNDLINLKTSNLTFASFVLIRNGIILFVLFFITTTYFNLSHKKIDTKKCTSVEAECINKENACK